MSKGARVAAVIVTLAAFTCGFVVRGFDVDEGLPLDLGKRVTEPELLPTQAIATGGAS